MAQNGVRPCAGRHFLRRRKNCVLIITVVVIMSCTVLQLLQDSTTYTPLRPLSCAKDEARRLLKFITHYNYACNVTVQAFNHTQWQICVDREVGLDLEGKDSDKIVYSIGPEDDYSIEKMLALNYSYNVFIISDRHIRPSVQQTNNTYVISTAITANDPADFSRNSYGQRTVNDVMKSLHHVRLDIVRLETLGSDASMWEVLHHMINDNLLMQVKQLHVTMRIDKLDEDYLYSWYRVVYGLFYKQGLWLYHTASSDSLCLQVTMMESCVYYMSFVRNPGSHVFVLHPPADFGTSALEESRLLTYISSPAVVCKRMIIGSHDDQSVQFTNPQWQVCSNSRYELFKKPCVILRYRMQNDHVLDQKFIQEGCSVHTLVLSGGQGTSSGDTAGLLYRMHSHLPHKSKTSQGLGQKVLLSSGDTFHVLADLGDISLVEIDVAQGRQWPVITALLDSGLLTNVSQVVARVVLPDVIRGWHPTVLRSGYSELRRFEAQGFGIFYSSAEGNVPGQSRLGENCCFQLGFKKMNMVR